MTNSKIFAIATLTGLLLVTVLAQNALAGGGTTAEDDWETPLTAKAVPGWVDNNFKWYGEGKIGQQDLLSSLTYMLDNGLMHLSDKAAQEMHDLRTENADLKKYKSQMLKSGSKGADVEVVQRQLNGDSVSISSIQVPDEDGELVDVLVVTDESTDPNALVQWVLKESYLETNKDLQFYADKVRHFNDMKEAVRDHVDEMRNKRQMAISGFENAGDPDRPVITGQVPNPKSDRPTEEVAFYYNKISFAHDTVDDIMAKGGTTSAWKDGIDKLSSIHGDSTVDSVVDDLQGIVVLCSTAIDNEILKIQAEMSVLEEIRDRLPAELTVSGSTVQYGESDMEFLQRHADRIDEKILSLQTGLDVLDEKLSTIGDDAKLANIDLQNTLQKQQQLLQMLSAITKSLHDTAMSTIRNVG